MLFAGPAVERAMKVQEVILRALSGALTWIRTLVPVRNLSSATELRQGWSTRLRRPGSKAEPDRGNEFSNLQTPPCRPGTGPDPGGRGFGSLVWRRAGTDDGVRRGAESPRYASGTEGRGSAGAGCSGPALDGGPRHCNRQVSAQQPMEVPLVQDHEVVETLSPDRSDDPLDEGILPGLEDGDLMTQRQVLEGDGGRPEEKRTEERRDSEQWDHGGSRAQRSHRCVKSPWSRGERWCESSSTEVGRRSF